MKAFDEKTCNSKYKNTQMLFLTVYVSWQVRSWWSHLNPPPPSIISTLIFLFHEKHIQGGREKECECVSVYVWEREVEGPNWWINLIKIIMWRCKNSLATFTVKKPLVLHCWLKRFIIFEFYHLFSLDYGTQIASI